MESQSKPERPKQGINGTVYITLLVIAIIILVLVFKPKPIKHEEINLKFDAVPSNYEKIVSFVMYFDQPVKPNEILQLNKPITAFNQEGIPITIFFTPESNTNKTINEIFDKEDRLGFNIKSIKSDNVEIGTSSFIAADLAELTYQQQELLIKKSKNSFKNQNITIKGLYIPQFSASFDTLLAIENSKMEYAIAGYGIEPMHPDTPLGIKMNLLLLPLSSEQNWSEKKGLYIIELNKDAVLSNPEALRQFLDSAHSNLSLFLNLSSVSAEIRKKEAISARITTDYKKAVSEIVFDGLKNNTKVDIITKLETIAVNSTNKSINYENIDDTLSLSLDEEDSTIFVYWK